jgi:hypothetical protein
MPGEAVHIEEFRLRVPGLSAEEARLMGEDVARRVAQTMPVHGRVEHLGVLDMKLSIPYATPRDRLAEEIARAIVKALA